MTDHTPKLRINGAGWLLTVIASLWLFLSIPSVSFLLAFGGGTPSDDDMWLLGLSIALIALNFVFIGFAVRAWRSRLREEVVFGMPFERWCGNVSGALFFPFCVFAARAERADCAFGQYLAWGLKLCAFCLGIWWLMRILTGKTVINWK